MSFTFQDISEQIDTGNVVDEEESDMEITDVEITHETDSDTADTEPVDQVAKFLVALVCVIVKFPVMSSVWYMLSFAIFCDDRQI